MYDNLYNKLFKYMNKDKDMYYVLQLEGLIFFKGVI